MSIDPISFTRSFKHKDWIDFVDSVQAGGGNGLNSRLHAIETDLDAIAAAFAAVNAALQALGTKPPPASLKITLIPVVLKAGAAAWVQSSSGISKDVAQAAAGGIMPVDLPHGATIQKLRTTGFNSPQGGGGPGTGKIKVTLKKAAISPLSILVTPIVEVDPVNNLSNNTAFDSEATANAAPDVVVVDRNNFTYFIDAELVGSLTTDLVQINQFQITYLTP